MWSSQEACHYITKYKRLFQAFEDDGHNACYNKNIRQIYN